MKLFLVKVKVTETRYMCEDCPETCEKLHIVRAEDKYQAANKVSNHYESKNESYCVYYNTVILDVTEEIS